MAKFEVSKFAKMKSGRTAGAVVGSVSYYHVDVTTPMNSGMVMNTPNEKFGQAIQALCGVLGVTEIETVGQFIRSSYTTYYRVKSNDGRGMYYTAADFTVVLSSMLSNRLMNGEKLSK